MKTFKTYDEQLDLLEKRGIDLSSRGVREKSKLILQSVGYYKLINGYKDPFLATAIPEDKYLDKTSMDEIYALYCFDRELREIFLRYILYVETNIKELISYRFSEKYGHENFLIYNNFNTSSKNADKNISSLLSDIQRQISSNTSDACINHYLKNYGYIPLWVLNNILTFGTISKFYSLMKGNDKQSIAKIFDVPDNHLESFLLCLSIVRNFSAHGNRLYCIRTSRPIVDTNIHKNLSIAKIQGEYDKGKRDLFSAVIVLRHLISCDSFKDFVSELSGTINTLSKKLNVININTVLSRMGFPHNWEDISREDIL